MSDLGDRPIRRLDSGYPELDRVLGGGVVPGSLVLVGGDPGIGKSTLLLQSASLMANRLSVLYVSAEESAQQVKLRWLRLGGESERLQLLAETDLELVLEELEALRPDVAIIDSIQALHDANLSSAPGSVAQVRECAASLQRLAKRQNTALLLVGHVTKEGMLAGPKCLNTWLTPYSRLRATALPVIDYCVLLKIVLVPRMNWVYSKCRARALLR